MGWARQVSWELSCLPADLLLKGTVGGRNLLESEQGLARRLAFPRPSGEVADKVSPLLREKGAKGAKSGEQAREHSQPPKICSCKPAHPWSFGLPRYGIEFVALMRHVFSRPDNVCVVLSVMACPCLYSYKYVRRIDVLRPLSSKASTRPFKGFSVQMV